MSSILKKKNFFLRNWVFVSFSIAVSCCDLLLISPKPLFFWLRSLFLSLIVVLFSLTLSHCRRFLGWLKKAGNCISSWEKEIFSTRPFLSPFLSPLG